MVELGGLSASGFWHVTKQIVSCGDPWSKAQSPWIVSRADHPHSPGSGFRCGGPRHFGSNSAVGRVRAEGRRPPRRTRPLQSSLTHENPCPVDVAVRVTQAV